MRECESASVVVMKEKEKIQKMWLKDESVL